MALRAVLDTLDGLDPVIAAEYVEKDGKFYLDVPEDSIRVHPHVLALKNAKDRQEAEAKRLKRELESTTTKLATVPEDFDREAYDRLVSEEDERQKNPNNHQQQMASQREMYEERVTRVRTESEAKLREKDIEIEARSLEIRTMKKDKELDGALDEVGVDPKARPAVKALLAPKVKVEFDKDSGEYSVFVPGDMGDQPVQQFVTNWAESDAGKFFISKPAGGDSSGGKGNSLNAKNNPWIVKDGQKPNKTLQQEAIQKDPAKARQMAISAGQTPNW